MEHEQGSTNTEASITECKDIISSLPKKLTSHILNRLPLQDAVRTGILAKDWRFKWNMLSHITFDEKFFRYLFENEVAADYGRIIHRVLFSIEGEIKKFVLYTNWAEFCGLLPLDNEEINQWILFLSRKGLEEFTFYHHHMLPPIKLPPSFFCCAELKHLVLFNCSISPPCTFDGFRHLLSLECDNVELERGKFDKLLCCPLLQVLKLGLVYSPGKVKLCKMKLSEIAKLENLKILSLVLCNNDNPETITTSPIGIFEILGSLPKLQELHLDFSMCEFKVDAAIKRLPITHPCLKTLVLSRTELTDGIRFSCAYELIRSCPNLLTLKIQGDEDKILALSTKGIEEDTPVLTPTVRSRRPEVDYSTMRLLQLRTIVINPCTVSEDELTMIEYLLACSPFLKKMLIRLVPFKSTWRKFEFNRKLLKLFRASGVIDMEVDEIPEEELWLP